MWRKTACAVGGLALACAATFYLTTAGSGTTTLSAPSLDLSWLYPSSKGDRLPVSRKMVPDETVMAFNVPSRSTTVVAKGPLLAPALRVEHSAVQTPRRVRTMPVNPVRDVPNEEKRQIKLKLPEGCEPSFSPVTVPALAHVASRCLS